MLVSQTKFHIGITYEKVKFDCWNSDRIFKLFFPTLVIKKFCKLGQTNYEKS